MLIEFERGRPIIVDRTLYRELVKGAIKRTHDELEAKAATAAQEKKAARASKAPADPVTVAKRERDAQLRELADQAHGANLDLGHALIHNLAAVDPGDIDVARFFVYALLGADHDSSPYTQTGERIARIAAGGVRLVVEELRADVTKTRKDGSRGRLRIDYGDHRDPQAAIAWLWKFIDGAKTAGELYGRALVVIAAEQHATPPRRARPASGCPPPAGARTRTSPRRRCKQARRPARPSVADEARAGRQARPQRLRQGRDRGSASSTAPSARRPRPSPPRARSTTSSTRTSPTPRSRSGRCVGRPATRGWHALAGVRVAGDRPAHRARATRPKGAPTMARRFNRRPLTEAERDARRQADRERIEQAARALLTSDGWQRWIRVRATNGLSRYSLRNQWLIAIECHARGITPTYVAGFRAFLALNRCVRKGEKAIRILAPVAVKQRDDAGEETGEKRDLLPHRAGLRRRDDRPAARHRARPARRRPRSRSRATATAT